MAGIRVEGNTSGNVAEVDASNNLRVTVPGYSSAGAAVGGGSANGPAMFSENDPGTVTGTRYVLSPETDDDYQLRVSQQVLLDVETFNYAAQNTGKHAYVNTTMTFGWATTGLTSNSGSITTLNTGAQVQTRAYFPVHGVSHTFFEFEAALTAAMPTNTTIDFGAFLTAGTNPYAPSDGVYFRYTSAGLRGVINYNGVETQTAIFSFSNVANTRNQYIISVSEREVEFWIDDVLYGSLDVPAGNGQPMASTSLPLSVRHAIGGSAASGAVSFAINDYTVSYGGSAIADTLSQIGNRIFGSYQGLSGGTMGSLANYANVTTPAGSGGSNTAANVNGLGGQGAINAVAGAATNDFVMTSYQVPAGTVAVQGRRLRVTGCRISCANIGAAVATTATTLVLGLAFGHTAVSLATAEGANAKAPRRIPLGIVYFPVGAVIGQVASPGDVQMVFESPIYVNPGEFIATTMKFLVGTATASQVIYYTVAFDYGWE